MNKDEQKKIDTAIRILHLAEKQAAQYNEPVEIAYSGGKDSDVLLRLAKESGINYRAIYKNTTIDPRGTIRHVRENGVEVQQPKMTFWEIIQNAGYPSRFYRFCCAKLKEYKILNVCALGVRTDESVKRKKRYTTFENCRLYPNKEKVHQYFPIWDWTLQDVAAFVADRKLKLAPVYYKEDGNIDYQRRLGCLGCPLASKNKRIEEFKANPALLRMWIKAGQKFLDTHSNTKANNVYGSNAYNMFYGRLFCSHLNEYEQAMSKDLFGNVLDCEKFIKDYFNI